MQNGLFQVKFNAVKQSESYLFDGSSNTVKSWHRKLGHISNENLKTLLQISVGINLTLKSLTELEKVCEICQKLENQELKPKNLCKSYTAMYVGQ